MKLNIQQKSQQNASEQLELSGLPPLDMNKLKPDASASPRPLVIQRTTPRQQQEKQDKLKQITNAVSVDVFAQQIMLTMPDQGSSPRIEQGNLALSREKWILTSYWQQVQVLIRKRGFLSVLNTVCVNFGNLCREHNTNVITDDILAGRVPLQPQMPKISSKSILKSSYSMLLEASAENKEKQTLEFEMLFGREGQDVERYIMLIKWQNNEPQEIHANLDVGRPIHSLLNQVNKVLIYRLIVK